MKGPSLLDVIDSDLYKGWIPDEPLPIPSGVREIYFDTETDGLDWYKDHRPIGLSYYYAGGKARYLPFRHIGGNLDEERVKEWARRELRGKKIFGVNTRFDIHMMREWGVDLEAQGNEFGDVQHYAALLDDSRRRFNLDLLMQDYFGERKVGIDLDGNRMAFYHASRVYDRAVADVVQTYRLKEKMWGLMTDQDLHRVREIEDDLIPVICEMEKNGAPIDTEMLDSWIKESERRRLYVLNKIQKHFSFRFDPNRNADWEKLFGALKIPIIHYTEKGAPSFKAENLRGIDNPWIQLALYADKLGSLQQKFLLPYERKIGSDGLLRYNLHQLRNDAGGTISGRLSSSNVNIQQVMTHRNHLIAFGGIEKLAELFNDDEMRTWKASDFQIRKLFVAEDGLWLSADMDQVEYRVFAHYANSPTILKKYAEDPNTDFHNTVMEMVQKIKPSVDRKNAKDLNFAIIFGAGKQKIAAMLNMGLAEGDEVTKAYHRAFPEARTVANQASRVGSTRGYVKTFFGRRGRFPDKKFLHKALNKVVQGTAADLSKKKAIEVHKARRETGFIFRFPVHDEFNGDSPDKRCTEMVTTILNEQTTKLRVPILWGVGTGKSWADAK